MNGGDGSGASDRTSRFSGLGRAVLSRFPRAARWGSGGVRFAVLVFRSFFADRCLLLASSLSYTTVLSLVPFLAVAFSVSKAFGIQNNAYIRKFLFGLSAEREAVVEQILAYIDNTNVSALGLVGIVTLIGTAVFLIMTIEDTLNIIWGAGDQPGYARRFVNYAAFVFLAPPFLIVGMSLTASLQSTAVFQWLVGVAVLGGLYIVLLKAMPYVLSCLFMFLLYKFVPNTRVRTASALAGAVVAGTLWQAVQVLYIRYQIGVTGYNAIYGSFAQIPLLMIWLYLSWSIVLLGAEISHAVQTRRTYRQEVEAGMVSLRGRRELALLALLALAGDFQAGRGATAVEDLAARLGAPGRLLVDILRLFADRRTVVRADDGQSREAYILSRPPDSVRVRDVADILESGRTGDDDAPFDPAFAFIRDIRPEPGEDGGPSLLDLAERYRTQLDPAAVRTPGAAGP
jgi:membrane protein